jgi:hypothetical protein
MNCFALSKLESAYEFFVRYYYERKDIDMHSPDKVKGPSSFASARLADLEWQHNSLNLESTAIHIIFLH